MALAGREKLKITEMRIPSKGEIVRTDTAYPGEIVIPVSYTHLDVYKRQTLEAICKALDCQPGDLLEYVPEDSSNSGT